MGPTGGDNGNVVVVVVVIKEVSVGVVMVVGVVMILVVVMKADCLKESTNDKARGQKMEDKWDKLHLQRGGGKLYRTEIELHVNCQGQESCQHLLIKYCPHFRSQQNRDIWCTQTCWK